MGIPAYFSYIVKNHPEIIRRLCKNDIKVSNFYLDSNSIIYDCVHNIDLDQITDSIAISIINKVIAKIEEYIDLISPNNIIYIAFDGVAPVAKLDQQRDRRYKSWYQGLIMRQINKAKKADPFNTTSITPGTKFMQTLNKMISNHFAQNKGKYAVNDIFVSTSDIPGEGEHKIFDFIRTSKFVTADSTNIVYGLDADLIMLSMNHLPVNNQIFLFRETPHFIQSIDSSLEPNETYLIDIPEFAKIVSESMNNGNSKGPNRTYDYILLCFFLGNDFMPHFPSINIRTGGVDKMISAYKATIGDSNETLTDGKTINWKNVRKIVQFLADLEEQHIQTEMKSRDRREKVHYPSETPEQVHVKFEAIPTYERELEKYINPFKDDWQNRYYKALFQMDSPVDDERKKQICLNYLSGLEWTMKYYTSGCADWRWSYNYNYPPLLVDLIKHVPYFDTEFVKLKPANPVAPLVQLCYVLPKASLELLPRDLHEKLLKKHSDWYESECDFIWAYCKYFWESHVLLPEIDIDELEEFINENKQLMLEDV
jgi:5'-3' exonuclease